MKNGLKSMGTWTALWSQRMLQQSLFPTSTGGADLPIKETKEAPCLLDLTKIKFQWRNQIMYLRCFSMDSIFCLQRISSKSTLAFCPSFFSTINKFIVKSSGGGPRQLHDKTFLMLILPAPS